MVKSKTSSTNQGKKSSKGRSPRNDHNKKGVNTSLQRSRSSSPLKIGKVLSLFVFSGFFLYFCQWDLLINDIMEWVFFGQSIDFLLEFRQDVQFKRDIETIV